MFWWPHLCYGIICGINDHHFHVPADILEKPRTAKSDGLVAVMKRSEKGSSALATVPNAPILGWLI